MAATKDEQKGYCLNGPIRPTLTRARAATLATEGAPAPPATTGVVDAEDNSTRRPSNAATMRTQVILVRETTRPFEYSFGERANRREPAGGRIPVP